MTFLTPIPIGWMISLASHQEKIKIFATLQEEMLNLTSLPIGWIKRQANLFGQIKLQFILGPSNRIDAEPGTSHRMDERNPPSRRMEEGECKEDNQNQDDGIRISTIDDIPRFRNERNMMFVNSKFKQNQDTNN